MKNTIKLLLLNFLLFAPCAIEAMGSMRTFGARAFKAATASAAKFKMNAQAFKTNKQPVMKPFNFKNGGKQGGYKKYAHTAAVMPIVKMGALYGAYDKVKGWLGYGYEKEIVFSIEAVAQKMSYYDSNRGKNIKIYIDFIIKNWDLLFINNDAAAIEKNIYTFMRFLSMTQSTRDFRNILSGKILEVPDKLLSELLFNCQTCLFADGDFCEESRRRIINRVAENPEYILRCLNIQINGMFSIKFNLMQAVSIYANHQEKRELDTITRAALIKLHKAGKLPHSLSWTINNFTNFDNLPSLLPTQTEAHVSQNFYSVSGLIKECPDHILPILTRIYAKERQERAKGNYVFYHAQAWNLHFYSDMYKQLWNIVKNDSVKDDFTFTRFKEEREAPCLRKDALYLNHALFGNSINAGSCTYDYFLKNQSIYKPSLSVKEFCENLGIKTFHDKYQDDFKKLEQFHEEASTQGNLLMVSVPADKVSQIKPVISSSSIRQIKIGEDATSDTNKILEALLHKPESLETTDSIEYAMPLTTEYALNPKKGPRFYSFNAADPEKLKEYTKKRDELFHKIWRDVESDKFLHNINVL